MSPLLVKAGDAADLLAICERQLRYLTQNGRIPAVTVSGRDVRYRVSDLEAFAAALPSKHEPVREVVYEVNVEALRAARTKRTRRSG